MKNALLLPLIALCLLTLSACSQQEDDTMEEVIVNPIRAELEQLVAEKDIEELWAVDVDICSSVTSYSGTQDFEFLDQFLRIRDHYYQYDSLVSFQTDESPSGNRMLLCFG